MYLCKAPGPEINECSTILQSWSHEEVLNVYTPATPGGHLHSRYDLNMRMLFIFPCSIRAVRICSFMNVWF